MNRIALIIAVTLSIAACGKEQPKKVEIRPVRVTSIQHTPHFETISLTGQIQAKDQVNLAFRIGDPVTPGQIVAKIESQDYQNALRSAEADLASASRVGERAKYAGSAERALEQRIYDAGSIRSGWPGSGSRSLCRER
jgi:multidrug efflux pump subunit AcrA (membrane-fusion protein)